MSKLKFLGFLSLILKSNRGSLAIEGDNEAVNTDYSDVEAVFDSLGTEDADSSAEDDATDGVTVENSDSDEQAEGNSEEMSLEDKLNGFEVEKAEGEANVLDLINQLGISRKGMPVEIESEDQLKELVSKGVDYTQKTQELADLRKEYEVELESREAELAKREDDLKTLEGAQNDGAVENQIFGQILDSLKTHDPDIFEWIQGKYQQGMSQYKMYSDNPVVNNLRNEIEQLKGLQKETEATQQGEDYSDIQKDWETGVSQVSSEMGAKLRSLGVKVDWNKIAETWSQGDLGVKEAVFSVYGEKISQAMEAKNKLLKTKQASQQRRGPNKDFNQEVKNENKSGSDESYVDWINRHLDN